MDFKNSIKKHSNDFLYLDPPYLISSSLYGIRGSEHRDFDHRGLAALLKKRNRWMLSYNDCTEIRTLYKGYTIIPLSWSYGMNKTKKSKEILILSKDIKW